VDTPPCNILGKRSVVHVGRAVRRGDATERVWSEDTLKSNLRSLLDEWFDREVFSH